MSRLIQTEDMLTASFGRPEPPKYKTEIPTYDSEDEWEYEYSTTETETYYLTLDLSIPEFTTRDSRHVAQAGRGGYLSSWIGEPNGDKVTEKPRYRFAADDLENEDDDEEAEHEEAEHEEADGDDDDVTKKRKGKRREDPEADKVEELANKSELEAAEIKILDLHSKTPIIAYRGRIFEAAWAQNTGTELIFAYHNEDDPLPRVSALPGDVDLLAASSARLLTTERKIQFRMDTNLAELKEKHDIHVVPGRDLNGERRKQATFLENLMAVKKMKGETDNVPVLARPPKNKNFKDDRAPDWKPRKRKIRAPEESVTSASAPSTSNTRSVDLGEYNGDSSQNTFTFQPPVTPFVAANGPVPYFTTPQFRSRRKRQEVPGKEEESRRVVNKANLPVEKSARTALLSEDHGVSVSSRGLGVLDIKGKGKATTSSTPEVSGTANDSDEEMGGV